jgi:hypothetical protein
MPTQNPLRIASRILAEDKNVIIYRPKIGQVLGSVNATLLLQQVQYWWSKSGNQPFYKFRGGTKSIPAPKDTRYKPGDSWLEELGFSLDEFSGALKRIGTKIIKGSSKAEILDVKELTWDEKSEKWVGTENLVLYWTTQDHLTYYELNEELFFNVLSLAYAESPMTTFPMLEIPTSGIAMSENPMLHVGKTHIAMLEIPTQIDQRLPETTTEKRPPATKGPSLVALQPRLIPEQTAEPAKPYLYIKRPPDENRQDWYKRILREIEEKHGPVNDKGNKITWADVMADLISEIYGVSKPPIGRVGDFAKQVMVVSGGNSGIWETFKWLHEHAGLLPNGEIMNYLTGTLHRERDAALNQAPARHRYGQIATPPAPMKQIGGVAIPPDKLKFWTNPRYVNSRLETLSQLIPQTGRPEDRAVMESERDTLLKLQAVYAAQAS